MEKTWVTHEFEPVFDENSRVLILGTIPSPKSREQGFYYGHPRNRFWNVISDVLGETRPNTIEEKTEMLLRNRIAVWDVLAGCMIEGADDASIRKPKVNDMQRIFSHAPIQAVFTTGTKAAALYRRYCETRGFLPCISLPSTSPANCRMDDRDLFHAYQILLKYLRTK